MGADKEFWLHRGLFWEFVDALTVGGRGVAASWRFANEHEKRPMPRKTRPRHGCLILEGVLAPKVPYCSLEEVLRNKLGVDVFIADMGFINIHSRFQMMRLARESFLHTLEVENLDQMALIGHSIGGLIALMLLGHFPDRVKKVFCIASPINIGAQTPWKALSWVISTFVARPHLQKKALASIIQRAIPHAEKVVTISTARDIILPNKATRFPFPGAKNYVYDAHHKGRFQDCSSALLDTHAGLYMHPFTLDIIFRTLQEEKS